MNALPQTLEATPNLLRPEQIRETQGEVHRIDGMLKDPRAQVEDRPAAMRQLKNMQNLLETQVPVEYAGAVKDAAAIEEVNLREAMVADGMPTQAEMRKAPPGAVNKLITWEARNKEKLKRWKYITMRLNVGSSDPDLTNFEKFRPAGGAQELSMDNAQIAGKQYRLPPPGAGPVVVMSDAEKTVLQGLNPEIASAMALATNEQRAEILEVVRGVMAAEEPVVEVKAKNVNLKWSDERKAAHSKLMKDKAAAKVAAEIKE